MASGFNVQKTCKVSQRRGCAGTSEEQLLVGSQDAYGLVYRAGKTDLHWTQLSNHAAKSNMAIRTARDLSSFNVRDRPGTVVIPSTGHQVGYEADWRWLSAKLAKNVKAKVIDYVLGCTAFNDVSAETFNLMDSGNAKIL